MDPVLSPAEARRILGVGDDVDAVSLRRAYHAAIRKAPPDSDPAGFARARAAYERLMKLARRDPPHVRVEGPVPPVLPSNVELSVSPSTPTRPESGPEEESSQGGESPSTKPEPESGPEPSSGVPTLPIAPDLDESRRSILDALDPSGPLPVAVLEDAVKRLVSWPQAWDRRVNAIAAAAYLQGRQSDAAILLDRLLVQDDSPARPDGVSDEVGAAIDALGAQLAGRQAAPAITWITNGYEKPIPSRPSAATTRAHSGAKTVFRKWGGRFSFWQESEEMAGGMR